MTTVGTCYWITGLAGAGKTTLARAFVEHRGRAGQPTVHVDGDELREVLGRTAGTYSLADRRELAMVYGRLCRLLAGQGVDVVCSTISMFDDVRSWNREHIERYVEVFVDAAPHVLERRDQKQLYSRAQPSPVHHPANHQANHQASHPANHQASHPASHQARRQASPRASRHDVVGVDLAAELPRRPDVHIVDDGTLTPSAALTQLLDAIDLSAATAPSATPVRSATTDTPETV